MPTVFLLAQQGSPQAGAGPWVQWLFPVAIVLILYFLMIRPMRQREKWHGEFLASLKSGDKVVTQGGLHGTVVSVGERTVQLRIADGVKVEVTKSAVIGEVPPEGEGR